MLAVLGTALGLLGACAPVAPPPEPSAADLAALREATHRALESNRDGESTNWAAEGSANVGTVTPTRTLRDAAQRTCREFQQTITLEGRTLAGYGLACRNAAGSWELEHGTPLAEIGPCGPGGRCRYRSYPFWPYAYYGPGYY